MGFQMQICSILLFSSSTLVKCCVHLRTSSSKTQMLFLEKNIFHSFYCFSVVWCVVYLYWALLSNAGHVSENALYKVLSDDDRIVSHDAPRFMLYYLYERNISWSVIFSMREMNIAVLDVDSFQTCFGSAASAFENIELAYIHCASKENFSITLKAFTCVSLICRGLPVRSVATKHKV